MSCAHATIRRESHLHFLILLNFYALNGIRQTPLNRLNRAIAWLKRKRGRCIIDFNDLNHLFPFKCRHKSVRKWILKSAHYLIITTYSRDGDLTYYNTVIMNSSKWVNFKWSPMRNVNFDINIWIFSPTLGAVDRYRMKSMHFA